MEHLEAKAATTPTTDRGEFEALVATWDRDRGGDVIKPGAFAKSIREWQEVGRFVPLHDDHDPAAIVGEVDPDSMVEAGDGLRVDGRLDLETERGAELWRSLKRNRIAFSFGYLATKERKRSDGGRDVLEVDLFEISLTSQPMNNRTKILSTKSATATESRMSEEDLEIVERSRREYQAARAAEAAAEEEEETPSLNWAPAQEPDPDKVIAICGTRVRVSDVRVNGR